MTITITDPALIDALQNGGDIVELQDSNGQLLGTVKVRFPYAPTPEQLSKVKLLSEEELERRRQTRHLARPLDLQELQRRIEAEQNV